MKVKLWIEVTNWQFNFVRTIYENINSEAWVTNTMSTSLDSIQSLTFKVSKLWLLYWIEVIKKDWFTLENAIEFQLWKRVFDFENFNEEDFWYTRNFEQLVNYLQSIWVRTKTI